MSKKEIQKLINLKYKTKVEASKDLGVSRQTINNWLNGTHAIPKIIIKYLKKKQL